MSYRKTLLFTAMILAGSISLTACTTAPMAPAATPAAPVAQAAAPAPSYPPSIGAMVAKTKTQIKTVKMPEFKAAYDRKDVGLLIDVRNENEFEDGYVHRCRQRSARPHRVPDLEAGRLSRQDQHGREDDAVLRDRGALRTGHQVAAGSRLHQRDVGRHEVRRLGEGWISGHRAEEIVARFPGAARNHDAGQPARFARGENAMRRARR